MVHYFKKRCAPFVVCAARYFKRRCHALRAEYCGVCDLVTLNCPLSVIFAMAIILVKLVWVDGSELDTDFTPIDVLPGATVHQLKEAVLKARERKLGGRDASDMAVHYMGTTILDPVPSVTMLGKLDPADPLTAKVPEGQLRAYFIVTVALPPGPAAGAFRGVC